MEKNDIIIIMEIFIILLLFFNIIHIEKKRENYDAGYNQFTTYRGCARKQFSSHEDVAFLDENNYIETTNCGPCDCNMQYLKINFTK